MDKDKLEKLLHYANRPLTKFIQYDLFTNEEPGDPIISPDEEGDAICGSITHELMSGAVNVRVLITMDTSHADVLRALKKIANWIMRDGLLRDESFSNRARKRVVSDEEYEELAWAAGGTNEAVERMQRMNAPEPPELFGPY